jgi:hypothetical protein
MEREEYYDLVRQDSERDGRLGALRDIKKLVEKRAKRNASRAKAMKEQFDGKELYGETEQTYLAFLREDSEISSSIDKLINAVSQPNQ